jgi:hypothetical protein
MTNVFKTPEKGRLKTRLFAIALETLRSQGWKIDRIPGGGASVRLITKLGEKVRISIRTTQDQWIAFPRRLDDKGWGTLSDVDAVLAVSVDDVAHPAAAVVHWIGADDMRARFDRTYKARLKAGHRIPLGRGVWLPLYIADDHSTARHAGGGAGLDHPEIARVPLNGASSAPEEMDKPEDTDREGKLLTIAEAKRRLALTLGVPEASIKISVKA